MTDRKRKTKEVAIVFARACDTAGLGLLPSCEVARGHMTLDTVVYKLYIWHSLLSLHTVCHMALV